jgi:hypothetical protein
MNKALLQNIFNHDFATIAQSADFHAHFFAKILLPSDLNHICETVCASSITLNGRIIPCALPIKGKGSQPPFMMVAQLHGNEPAGLAGIALVMALAEAGQLERDVIAVIGNPLAARQYFAHRLHYPDARQETRDAYRCGLDEQGHLYPDMNRIPVDFLTRSADHHHIKRAQELYVIGTNAGGVVDLHSARGNMLCITDHRDDRELKNSPIRAVLTGLAEAISAHASATVSVKTLKTTLAPLPNIAHQIGIEAGRHEAPDAPFNAANFTLSLLNTLGITSIAPLFTGENGLFDAYAVQPRITYGDLEHAPLREGDHVYMATPCHSIASIPSRSDSVIVKKSDGCYAVQTIIDFTKTPAGSMEYAVYQYDEMEAIASGHSVAVAVPSGVAFKTTSAFSGIFISKSAALYDKDPAVGPWPVAAEHINNIKFCYPCRVRTMTVEY